MLLDGIDTAGPPLSLNDKNPPPAYPIKQSVAHPAVYPPPEFEPPLAPVYVVLVPSLWNFPLGIDCNGWFGYGVHAMHPT